MLVAASFGDSLQSGADTFLRVLPGIVGTLVLLGIGWIMASVRGRAVQRVPDKMGADRLSGRVFIDGFPRADQEISADEEERIPAHYTPSHSAEESSNGVVEPKGALGRW